MITQVARKNGKKPFLLSTVTELFDVDHPGSSGFSTQMFSDGHASQWYNRIPPANVRETHEDYTIELAVPGLAKEDLTIEVDNKLLTISTTNEEQELEEDERFTRREFNYCNISRTFLLSQMIDQAEIVAKYRNGILELRLPKKPEAKKIMKKKLQIA